MATWLHADDPVSLLGRVAMAPWDEASFGPHTIEPVTWSQASSSSDWIHEVVWCARNTGARSDEQVAVHRFIAQAGAMPTLDTLHALAMQDISSSDDDGGEAASTIGGFHGQRDLMDRPEVQDMELPPLVGAAIARAALIEAASVGRTPIPTQPVEAWVNALYPGGWNVLHTHAGSCYSAVLFLDDGGCCGSGSGYEPEGEGEGAASVSGRLALLPGAPPPLTAATAAAAGLHGDVLEAVNAVLERAADCVPHVRTGAHAMAAQTSRDGAEHWPWLLLDPIPGTCIVFPSAIAHCVLPTPRGSAPKPRVSIAFNYGACEPVMAHLLVMGAAGSMDDDDDGDGGDCGGDDAAAHNALMARGGRSAVRVRLFLEVEERLSFLMPEVVERPLPRHARSTRLPHRRPSERGDEDGCAECPPAKRVRATFPDGNDDEATSQPTIRTTKRISSHLEGRRCGARGNGVFATMDLPPGFVWHDSPVSVPATSNPDGSVETGSAEAGGAIARAACRGAAPTRPRRLPSLWAVDELMQEIFEGVVAGTAPFPELLRGPWRMSYVDRHLEMQGDPSELELPEYAVRLGICAEEYNLLAAMLQSNVARDGTAEGECGGSGLCLMPNIRLVNHSCAPNMELGYAPPSTGANDPDGPNDTCPPGLGSYVLRALRPIRAGEELTFSYIGTNTLTTAADRDERQALLSRRWGFLCDCTLCTEQTAVS